MILVVNDQHMLLLTTLLARSDHPQSVDILRQIDKRRSDDGVLTIDKACENAKMAIGPRRLAALKLLEATQPHGALAAPAIDPNWSARLRRVKSELNVADADEIIGLMVEKALEISVLCAFLAKPDRPGFIAEIAASIAENADDWGARMNADLASDDDLSAAPQPARADQPEGVA